MKEHHGNPSFTAFFRFVTIAELLVVGLAGVGLFFLPGIARTLWPWHITPFNMFFLGGAYLSSLATIAVMLSGGRWAPARLGLWMLVAFTVPILFLSLLHLSRFDFQRWATWIWFFLFLTIAPYSVYTIWRYRHLPPGTVTSVPTIWRWCLLIQGIVLGLYALALLLSPTTATAFWPWPIDEFHGRVYSAIFLTGAAGALVVWFSAASTELLMLGMTQSVLGLCSVIGLVVADSFLHRANWSLVGTWVWIGFFIVLFMLGLAFIWLAISKRPVGHQRLQESIHGLTF